MYIHYLVIDVQLVNSSENNDIFFSEVANIDVNITNNINSSILIPYAVIMERATSLPKGIYISVLSIMYCYDT